MSRTYRITRRGAFWSKWEPLGNPTGRLVLGGATDVLYLGRGLIWNIADVAIVVGMLLATWVLARQRATQGGTGGGREKSFPPPRLITGRLVQEPPVATCSAAALAPGPYPGKSGMRRLFPGRSSTWRKRTTGGRH